VFNRSALNIRKYFSLIVIVSSLMVPGVAAAAGSLVVTPDSGLSNGQSVSVSGSGLTADSTGSVLECNSDLNQPTITLAGNAVPISCSNPLSKTLTTNKSGAIPSTSFMVHTGTVGPPGTGTDSNGGSAAANAVSYPCPPTTAQLAAGDYCEVTYGDAANDDVSKNITFTSKSSSPATASNSSPNSNTLAPTSSSKPSSTLINTGPDNIIAVFIVAVFTGSLLFYGNMLRKNVNT
jgi:hypothetical protein